MNAAYSKKEFSNAIKFYSEGIEVNCTDVELKAKLYNNRSTAYFCLGKILFFGVAIKAIHREHTINLAE